MAKADGPGFVDKYIEKVVLLVCLLVLIYALSQYGVSSKRTYEIAGQQEVRPKQIDAVLLAKAKELDGKVEAQESPRIKPRDDLALLETMQKNPLPVPQPADRQVFGVQGVEKITLPFGMPSKLQLTTIDIDGPGQTPSLAKLIEVMPAPGRPQCWSGEELMVREVPGPDGEPEVKIEEPPTWRAVSWYSWRELDDAWQKLLRTTVIEPKLVALGYEAEIQIKHPDGSWKTSDDVKPVLLPVYDTKTGDIIQPAPLPEYTGANGEMVWEWLRLFSEEWTPYQLQPDYHEVWIRDDDDPTWEAHFPFDVLTIYPSEETDAAIRKTTAKKRTTRSNRTSLLNRLQRTRSKTSVRSSRRNIPERMPEGVMMPPPEMFPMNPGAVPRGRATSGRTTTTRRPLVQPKTTVRKAKIEEEEPVEIRPEIPDYETQYVAGKILLWFHVNNIQLGREYRCRFRMVFANPLLTYDKDVEEENRKDAYVPSIKTKWSEWSEPVCVKREVEFFVTGAFPVGNSITVTVFTRWMDQRLMYPINKVKAGERIRGSRKVKVLNPITGEAMKDEDGQDPVIEFDTGAVAIQLDFDRRIRISGRDRDDVEMIYLDPEGNLRSRSLYMDRNSAKYKELETEAREAAAAFKPERPKRPAKEAKGARRKRLPPEFGEPGMAPPDMNMPGQDNPFEVNTRSRKSSSKSRSKSKSRDRDR